MSRTVRAIIGVIFVLVAMFSLISISERFSSAAKLDITEQKLYTLSSGTKAILAKLSQPVKMKLYYTKTAAMKGPDQIRYFNNYFQFVKSLLDEYVLVSGGNVVLDVIDPRPFSEDEVQALRYGLKKVPITEEENFFFGLVVQTQFGVEKVVPFFSPERQNFVEYDISYLIDMSITRQKKRVGILSSLPVMGDDVSGYMAQMLRMQGQQPRPSWTFIEQLRRQCDVKSIAADVNEIKDVDILLAIHPKNLPKQTQFAIDQFVLKGGRAIICVDPYCYVDSPQQMGMQTAMDRSRNSDLNVLLRTWGVEMKEGDFVGDRALSLMGNAGPDQQPEKIVGLLGLKPPECFSSKNVITANLNRVMFLFAGSLKEVKLPDDAPKVERTALVMSTGRGNTAKADDLAVLSPSDLLNKFTDGNQPQVMGYLITGRFRSSFPDGVDVEEKSEPKPDLPQEAEKEKKPPVHLAGLKEASQDCAVVVLADADFLSDILAYQNSFFGKIVVGDNSNLALNAIDTLSGSSDLISMRSRGNFGRPFAKVDEIEKQAEAATAEEESRINAEIEGFQKELGSILSSAKEGEEEIVGGSILQKKKDLELKLLEAQRKLRLVKMKKRERIEQLGNRLRSFNMLAAPAVILVIAIILSVRRGARKRYYISHASDA